MQRAYRPYTLGLHWGAGAHLYFGGWRLTPYNGMYPKAALEERNECDTEAIFERGPNAKHGPNLHRWKAISLIHG